jgi:hypothetical protein
MSGKILKDNMIWKVNGFQFYIEPFESELIIKDEYGNSIKISKKDPLFVLLNLEGSFKPD